jgi:hypothetical protein
LILIQSPKNNFRGSRQSRRKNLSIMSIRKRQFLSAQLLLVNGFCSWSNARSFKRLKPPNKLPRYIRKNLLVPNKFRNLKLRFSLRKLITLKALIMSIKSRQKSNALVMKVTTKSKQSKKLKFRQRSKPSRIKTHPFASRLSQKR